MPEKRLPPVNAIAVAAVDARKMWPVTKAIDISAASAKKDATTSQSKNRVVARQLQSAAANTKKEAASVQSNSS